MAPTRCWAPNTAPSVGAVAQLGERLVRNEEVSGSIPLGSTNLKMPMKSAFSANAKIVAVRVFIQLVRQFVRNTW